MIVMVAAMFSNYHCFVEQMIIVYHTIDYINVFHCCWILTVDYTDYSYWLLLLLWLLWLSLLFLLLLFVLIFLVLFGGNLRVHVDRFPKLGMPIAIPSLLECATTWCPTHLRLPENSLRRHWKDDLYMANLRTLEHHQGLVNVPFWEYKGHHLKK